MPHPVYKPYEAPFYAGPDTLFALTIQRREQYTSSSGLASHLEKEGYEAGRAEWTAFQVFEILADEDEEARS